MRGDKQASVCLGAIHLKCETYRDAQAAAWRRREDPGSSRRAIVATAPVVLGGNPASLAAHAPARPDLVLPRLHLRPVARRTAAAVLLAVFALVIAGQLLPRLSANLAVSSTAPTRSVEPDPSQTQSSVPSIVTPTSLPGDDSASPSASPPPIATPTPRLYTVQPGDSLYAIARHFGTTIGAIREANGLGDSDLIQPGQVLIVP